MKPEELLNSLDYIGNDLLSEAENTVLVKTRRPWFKTAVAAVLVAAVGVGGWLFLKNVNMKPSVSATEPEVSKPIPTDTQIVTTDLPVLEVGDAWQYLPSWYYTDSQDAPGLYDPSITQLPVYRDKVSMKLYQNNSSVHEEAPVFYSEEQLRTILSEAAQRIGATIIGEVNYVRSEGICFSANVNTDRGSLRVSSDGLVQLSNNDTSYFTHLDSAEDLWTDTKKMNSNIARARDLLTLPQYQDSVIEMNEDDEWLRIFPAPNDAKERLLAYTFGSVRITAPRDEYSYDATMSWYQRPGSTGWDDVDQDWRELAGNYPLITLEEAKEQLAAGHYYSRCYDEPYFGSLTLEQLNNVELVYPYQGEHATMMPFYRFDLGTNLCDYICVPAVRPEYLSDFPAESASFAADACFRKVEENGRVVFTNDRVEIWQDDNTVMKKELASGETAKYYLIESSDEWERVLIAVSDQSLYFGKRSHGSTWEGMEEIYTVDVSTKTMNLICERKCLSFEEGMIILHEPDRTYDFSVIDRNDQMIISLGSCWGFDVIDGSVYYVYTPDYPDWDSISNLTVEDGLHTQYAVCRIDPNGTNTQLGSFEMPFIDCTFQFDRETKELYFDWNTDRVDLLTAEVRHIELEPVENLEPVEPKNLVNEALHIEGTYTDGVDNVYNYSYSIPHLDANTPDAIAINAEIDEKWSSYARDVDATEDGNSSLPISTIEYRVSVWNDVVSIMIEAPLWYGDTEYDVYCYDCSTGRRLTLDALLRKMNISREDFLIACAEGFHEEYLRQTPWMSDEERKRSEESSPALRPNSVFKVNMELHAYPNENGDFVVVAPITTWAGGDFYYFLVTLPHIE